ncbi:MAG: heme ABC exporter ATP-binding protein CcmA [Candidatus Lambdaproteobacteria bacterium]|nr:heme ABC exporter ATP-binding protein CcmA [Candidatus Lambdaproteobacteria bacterium]
MSASPVFTLAGVTKRFGYRTVLRDVSFEIAAGEFVLVLGNNGAGKSTLLKLVSSLMRPSAGELCFAGRPYRAAGPDLRRALGMISHESRLYGDLTARENLHLFGTLYGVAELKGRIAAALAEVRLEGYPDLPTRAFSSGMLKRLSLARLLLYEPTVLLLDEPYSGLDLTSVELLDGFLRRFRAGGGTTLLITHQFTGGVGLATRILVLQQGALVYNNHEQDVTGQRCAALLAEYGGAAPARRLS